MDFDVDKLYSSKGVSCQMTWCYGTIGGNSDFNREKISTLFELFLRSTEYLYQEGLEAKNILTTSRVISFLSGSNLSITKENPPTPPSPLLYSMSLSFYDVFTDFNYIGVINKGFGKLDERCNDFAIVFDDGDVSLTQFININME